ncbi:MAG: hypothetical protein IKY78_06255 [Clostridia bacterium]|nr:hypothetical protein [Clostridia bacterium]
MLPNILNNNPEILSINGYKFYCTKKELPNTDYTFVLDDKTLNEDYFTRILEVDLEKGAKRRYIAENGATVIRLRENIPVFDSGDCMYDSYKVLLIYSENGKKTGLFLRGGYCLASAVLCTELVCADEKTKQMIDELEQSPVNAEKTECGAD